MKRIAVPTSGGGSPGMNAAIRAVGRCIRYAAICRKEGSLSRVRHRRYCPHTPGNRMLDPQATGQRTHRVGGYHRYLKSLQLKADFC